MLEKLILLANAAVDVMLGKWATESIKLYHTLRARLASI